MELKQKIIDLLIENFKKTHGGLNLIQLAEKLQIGQEELKQNLNELYKEKRILIRQGINHKIIYPNEKTL